MISIRGSDCSIENLGQLSELSGGSVDRVDPLNITKNFQSILSLPVIATHVCLDIHLHKGLFIRTDDPDETSNSKSFENRTIGNVTKETVTTIDYGIRQECKKDFTKLKSLPFQIQIRYTRASDGMVCMRVITKTQELTFDKNQAEEHANLRVLGTASIQTSAKMAHQGNYSEARMFNLANKAMFSRAVKTPQQEKEFSAWSKRGQKFEQELSNVQQTEQVQGIKFDNESDKKKEKQTKFRKQARTDTTSNMLYKLKSENLKKDEDEDY